ncbi:hypothetical protein ONS95_005772 [Cadophora gregata]|uniref:uncharacterized protein n=1 Tax=Cadophora gregata TaxID=51156 RepID=UPI0026DD8BC0|nr:uncharacterized protein ONS95_005772 [Cadophora gregata]KAK0103770.1 hypothetical protein ONS95_005772 [Cadophora gregata]
MLLSLDQSLAHLSAKMSSPVAASPVRKAHKGLVRDDLLVLRQIFDLNHGKTASDRDLPNDLILASSLPDSNIKDLLIVSLDVENPPCGTELQNNSNYQLGLCVLDTRELGPGMLIGTQRTNSHELLRTFQLVIGSAKYNKKAAHSYCFGESQHISLPGLNAKLQELIPPERDAVLVLHGGVWDLKFLEAAKLDLNHIYVIDTQKAAQHPLDLDHRCTMEEMLTLLGCPFGELVLHTAGNDANFTLRALLLIAKTDACAASDPYPIETERLLSLFEEIALGPVPLSNLQSHVQERRQIEQNQKEARARKQRRKRAALRAKETQVKEGT